MAKNSNEKLFSKTTVLNSVTAGYVAGICGTIVGHPLDSIKVLLQTKECHDSSSGSSKNGCHKYNNHARNMSTLSSNLKGKVKSSLPLSSRSLRSLYSGITGPLLSVGVIQALTFSIYDTSRRCMCRFNNQMEDNHNDYLKIDPLRNVFCAAVISGTALSVFTGPLQVIKTKQQIMVWSFQRAIKDTMSMPRLFVGNQLHAFSSGVGRGIYMTTYEYQKRYLSKQYQIDEQQIPPAQRALCAAHSGIICWALIFPADVVRNRMIAHTITSHRQNKHNQQGVFELVKQMYIQGGNSIKPFYRGFWITLLRAGPVAATVLPIYDLTLQHLQDRHTWGVN